VHHWQNLLFHNIHFIVLKEVTQHLCHTYSK
jgi:hypothetical protein